MLLVIAATEKELAGAAGARTLVCGIGPGRPTRQPRTRSPRAARRPCCTSASRARGAPPAFRCSRPCSAREAVDCDGDSEPIAPAARLLAAARRALPDALALPIGTSAHVGGTADVDVEAMEGHAVLAACLDEGVPALELRVISNEIEEGDRSLWRFDEAFAELARVTALVIAEIERA